MQNKELRRKRFKHALIEAEMTQRQFAKVLGVTEQHLIAVLSGGRDSRDSRRITSAVDVFVAANPVPAQGLPFEEPVAEASEPTSEVA